MRRLFVYSAVSLIVGFFLMALVPTGCQNQFGSATQPMFAVNVPVTVAPSLTRPLVETSVNMPVSVAPDAVEFKTWILPSLTRPVVEVASNAVHVEPVAPQLQSVLPPATQPTNIAKGIADDHLVEAIIFAVCVVCLVLIWGCRHLRNGLDGGRLKGNHDEISLDKT